MKRHISFLLVAVMMLSMLLSLCSCDLYFTGLRWKTTQFYGYLFPRSFYTCMELSAARGLVLFIP